ncbi:porin family protein [Tenacibaculum sp. 190524A02b]|uniref:OMP_b-brl_2 domain-containing protein n=1 Tax=Tenacibaculum vairaonense TaxID=3137860 RepID=A0ABM9PPP7_9FLAO
MKKVLLLCAVLSVNYIFSQEIKYGIKGGINSSNFSQKHTSFTGFSPGYISGGKVGFQAGFFVEIPLSEKFSLQPELIYSRLRGNNTKSLQLMSSAGDFTTGHLKGVEKYSFLELPIMLKYNIFKKFNLEFGPQLQYTLAARVDEDLYVEGEKVQQFGGYDFEKNSSRSILGEFSKLNFGLNFGASYDINKNIFIQGRYNLGLTKFNESFRESFSLKNSNVQISLGYRF